MGHYFYYGIHIHLTYFVEMHAINSVHELVKTLNLF